MGDSMSRLAKKFLRPDSVDGSKIKLSNDEALRASNAAGNGSVSFLKVNSSDKPEFLILPILSVDPTESEQVSRKGYVDTKAENEAASALSSANSYTDTAISNLVNGAPALLDTLKELADALGSDENFAVTIGNQITELDGRLDIIEGGSDVENSLLWWNYQSTVYADQLMAQEVIDRDAAISVAQTFLQGEIDQEISDREAAVQNEADLRLAADDILDGRLDIIEGADTVVGSVAKALKDAKAYTDSEISDEVTARDAAIAVEAGLREDADDALDARLDIVQGDDSTVGSIAKSLKDAKDYTDSSISSLVNGAPALLDTLKELADALGGDENFAVTIAGQISALDGRLDTLEGADTVTGSVLWGVKQAKDYADDLMTQEVIDRDAAIAVEAGVREDADDLLDGRLDVIEGSGPGSIAKAQSDAQSYADGIVATEQGLRETADEGLQDQLDTHDAEITDLQSAVSSLNSGTFHKQKKVLSGTDITNQYVDLAYEAKAYSTMVFVQGSAGGYMHEGDDYTVSTVGGVTRITFAGDFATGGVTALDSSDVMYFQFQYVP